jgi:hypothetical protein
LRRFAFAFSVLALSGPVPLRSEDPCEAGLWTRVTNEYRFSASAGQGARGDVTAVDLFLTVDSLRPGMAGFVMTGCFDPRIAELAAPPVFTEHFRRLVSIAQFASLGEDTAPRHPNGDGGFTLISTFVPELPEIVLAGGHPLPIGTLFFRLVGAAGTSAEIRFCDGEFVLPSGACSNNTLDHYAPEEYVLALSEKHEPGFLRVLPGMTTRPYDFLVPPSARIYASAPSPSSVDVSFDLGGAISRPGGGEVPLELRATSSHEFCGYSVNIEFPPSAIEVVRVLEAAAPGDVTVDATRGRIGIVSEGSLRRLGGEGETVLLATVYVRVKDAVSGVDVAQLRFRDEVARRNWVLVRHASPEGEEFLPLTVRIAPDRMGAEPLRIQSRPTTAGDVNLDYELNLTDAIVALGLLFRGAGSGACAPAAEFNGDGRLDIADPIALLRHLFNGGPRLVDGPPVLCD